MTSHPFDLLLGLGFLVENAWILLILLFCCGVLFKTAIEIHHLDADCDKVWTSLYTWVWIQQNSCGKL